MSALDTLLELPFAHGGPVCSAHVRRTPEDFIVREWLGFEPEGDGPHWLLTVRKRDANTQWVARELARMAGVHPREVGYAGLKDRHAVTEQSFTVPVTTAEWNGIAGQGFEVVRAVRHRRKLKIGALKANEFALRLRDVQGDDAALNARLQVIATDGVPNYFGPQRFGRDANNLRSALRWFESGMKPEDRQQQSFALSAARSALFNRVVARRIERESWNRLLPGDVANLDGSNSIFDVPELDETLARRCAELDIHPTAPLWGRGELRSGGAVAELEQGVASALVIVASGLESAGLEKERRATRIRVQSLEWQREGRDVLLQFRLNRGCFATSVLRELVGNADDLPGDE
ncbi:MAG: tRNA pseudouridine(13) synthase TruD, partial [Steroidobacteraceae bacterium]